jgi:hypothetical protein
MEESQTKDGNRTSSASGGIAMAVTSFEHPDADTSACWPSMDYLRTGYLSSLITGFTQEVVKFWTGIKAAREPRNPKAFQPFGGTVDTKALLQWLDANVCQNEQFQQAQTILIMSENRELDSQLWFLEHTLRKLLARTAIYRQEQWHIIFVPLTTETGLDQVHFTWGGVYPLEALSTRYKDKNFVLWDCDAAPTALYDILDLIDLLDLATAVAHPEWEPTRMRPGIAVVSERYSNVNAGIVYVMGDPNAPKQTGSVKDWLTIIDKERLAMVNSNSGDGIGTLWNRVTNAPVDLNIDEVHSKLQDWQQKARQAAGDPHFFGKYARNGADYTHIWAMFGLVINKLAHGTVSGAQVKKAYIAHLPEGMNLITGLGKWAGPFYEQGILKLLDAYETEGAYYGRLPG